MQEILIPIIVLCVLAGALTILLLIAEQCFCNYGECEISINQGDKQLKIKGGLSLLRSLGDKKVFLPSACGGRGSCGFCKCKITSGGGSVLPTELPYLSELEIKQQIRLSCQLKVKNNLKIEVAEELLAVRQFKAKVKEIVKLTHDILSLRLSLPEGEAIKFKAGQYMQLVAPPCGDLRTETFRAYSIASRPADHNYIELIIRLVPNGIVTTYVFEHLHTGDLITITGPYGDFFLRDTDREIVCIAGGSGLAPIRSIILDMIDKKIKNRKAGFYFGAVSERDLYYVEDFKELEHQHPWFSFIPSLSNPGERKKQYRVGLVTDIVAEDYQSMNDLEAYLCGSPGMIDACVKFLSSKGMLEKNIFYDKFS